MTTTLLKVLVLALIGSPVMAQTACPQGVSAGSAQCGPLPLPALLPGVPNRPCPQGKWQVAGGRTRMADTRGEQEKLMVFPVRQKGKKLNNKWCASGEAWDGEEGKAAGMEKG